MKQYTEYNNVLQFSLSCYRTHYGKSTFLLRHCLSLRVDTSFLISLQTSFFLSLFFWTLILLESKNKCKNLKNLKIISSRYQNHQKCLLIKRIVYLFWIWWLFTKFHSKAGKRGKLHLLN